MLKGLEKRPLTSWALVHRGREKAEKEAAERRAALDAERTHDCGSWKLEEEQNSEHNKVEQWSSWDPMKFASAEEREEAEIQHEIARRCNSASRGE